MDEARRALDARATEPAIAPAPFAPRTLKAIQLEPIAIRIGALLRSAGR